MARKLKKFVIPSALGVLGISCIISAPFIFNSEKLSESNYHYTVSEIKERIFPVTSEVEERKSMKPFVEETVSKTKDYYNKDDSDDIKQNSLIYYDKTYMPSTGIIYSGEENFDVCASNDGKVTKIGEDNLLGKYITIDHLNGYKTSYYSLSSISVSEGAEVLKGDIIGASGTNKIETSSNSNLLFEAYYEGYLIDPEDFYNVDFNNLN